jgi:non-ribosomal peptide synthase protein (TIGR01720 family)
VVVVQAGAGGEKRLVGYVVRAEEARAVSMKEWRSWLGEQLPEYMIPAVVVELRELPLTANGKVDRRALPKPDGARSELGASYEAPRNEVEAELCRLWAAVLGLERVGIHDNFFELGGDSILSIQIVARANQKGLRVAHRHLFEHRTVAELAAVVDTTPVIETEQGEVSGEQRLTPIQQWFFTQSLAEPEHWNQTTLVSVSGRLQPELLKGAVGALLRHHDALRLRFSRAGEGAGEVTGEDYQAHYAAVSSVAPSLTVHDLSGMVVAEQRGEVERLAAAAQSSLDLSEGPLLQVHYYKLGADESGTERGRLLMVVHHLAVDTVSWGILLEDLQRGYEQLEQGAAEVQLPAKTTSYQQWAEVLQEYAQSLRLLVQIDYWLDDERREVAPLPTDFSDGENLESTTRQLSMYLNVEETQKLVFEVPKAADVQVNEVLLTALAETLSQWTGDKHVLIDVEGHGREETVGEVDLTRTVGWFTTLHPALLILEDNAPWEERLRMVTKQLRAVPMRGIGYGVLRYLSGKKEIVDRLESLPQPEISFNYSRFVQGQEQEPERLGQGALRFGPAPESSGPLHSARARRTHLLEVNASIAGQQLFVRWSYSDRRHERATVERLAREFLNGLRGLIDSFQESEFQPQPFSPGIKESFATPQLSDEPPLWAPLVPLQQRGSKAPFFCVHPAGGSVLPLVDLARQFIPDRPFYGLQAVGLYEEREPYITMEEMAARYVDEIRLIQHDGPYVIGGLSFGGNVAFEMAQQLHNQNQAVSLLAILDTIAPSSDSELMERTHDPDVELFSWATDAAEASGKKLSLSLDEFRQLNLEAQREFVLDQLRVIPVFAGDTKLRTARRRLKISQYHGRASRNYRPRVYPDRITLFRSSDIGDSKYFKNMYDHPSFADPTMGWGPLSAEPIEIYRVPGDHGQIVTEPYVRIMAQQMRSCLEKRTEVFANEAQPQLIGKAALQ